jgi:glutamine amidotransferase-like uncharacterized protein
MELDELINKSLNETLSRTVYNVYFNGGCYFNATDQHPNVQILAHYNNKGSEGRAAIVECQIGNTGIKSRKTL